MVVDHPPGSDIDFNALKTMTPSFRAKVILSFPSFHAR